MGNDKSESTVNYITKSQIQFDDLKLWRPRICSHLIIAFLTHMAAFLF